METLEKALSTKIKVLKEEECLVTYSVELPKDEVSKELESVYQSIQSRAALPGFRTGKAPMELVRKNFADKARQMLLEKLISQASTQVIREKKLEIVDTPQVEKIDYELGKPLVFHLRVERDPEIKVKDYKGIKVTRPSAEVKENDIQKAMEELRERNATLVASASAKVEKSHFAVIDFEGRIDGKTFEGGTSKGYLLDMAQPQTIAGFSEGILGAEIGAERAVTVRFPADYGHKEYAGKEAVFQVTVKEIKEKKLPSLDDDFAKDLGLTSAAELKQKVTESLQKDLESKAEKTVMEQIETDLLKNHSFTVPPTLVEERTRTLTQRALSNLQRQGLVAAGDKQAEETIRGKTKPQAERDVRLSYIFKGIAAQEKLEATQADIDDLKKKALEETKDNAQNVEKYFQERDYAIRASLTEGKVLDFLKNNAKVKPAKD